MEIKGVVQFKCPNCKKWWPEEELHDLECPKCLSEKEKDRIAELIVKIEGFGFSCLGGFLKSSVHWLELRTLIDLPAKANEENKSSKSS